MNATDIDDADDLVVIETKDTKADKAEIPLENENVDENGRGRLVGQILSTQRALGQTTKPITKIVIFKIH